MTGARLRDKAGRERPDAEVVQAPAEHLPFDEDRFDAVVSIEPIQEVVGRNCHLTRDLRSAVEAAGFDASGAVGMDFKPMPAMVRTVISGVATAPV